MVRVHATRLMPVGEVALWYRGKLEWTGLLGSDVGTLQFDCVSVNVADQVRLERSMTGRDVDGVLRAIAAWWSEEG